MKILETILHVDIDFDAQNDTANQVVFVTNHPELTSFRQFVHEVFAPLEATARSRAGQQLRLLEVVRIHPSKVEVPLKDKKTAATPFSVCAHTGRKHFQVFTYLVRVPPAYPPGEVFEIGGARVHLGAYRQLVGDVPHPRWENRASSAEVRLSFSLTQNNMKGSCSTLSANVDLVPRRIISRSKHENCSQECERRKLHGQ